MIMAYSSGGRLPFESASKLGHLNVIESDWVKSLLSDFETNDLDDASNYENNIWEDFDPSKAEPLKHIWVADGSYVPVEENHKELAFVKTALMTVEQKKIAEIDKDNPHPLKLQEIMKAHKFSKECSVEVGDDMPLHVIFTLPTNDGKLEYLLAPRLEND